MKTRKSSGSLPRLRALRPRPLPPPPPPPPEEPEEENEEVDDEDTSHEVEEEETNQEIENVAQEDSPVEEEEGEGKLVIKDETADEVLGEKSYECKTCKPAKELATLKAYLHHLKKEHKQRVRCYECPHCEYVCQHAKKLQRHFRVAHEDLQDKVAAGSAERSRCPMCAHIAANQRDLETHQRVHHLKRRFFRCAKCSYVTHVRARYTKHVKYHSMPMIKCDACDFRTPYKWNLDRHTRNHGGGGTFQCRACNFTADIRQSLTVHEMNHHEPPVGQPHRKLNTPFERKPRNSPKRYNQVGASDFRDNASKASAHSSPAKSTGKSPVTTPVKAESLPEDRESAIASAECIALKCEEKGCQFITAWDSEMQRHLVESHSPPSANKAKKPLPMLIPLGSPNSSQQNGVSGNPSTLLKVPRVRVRPELAQIARDTEMAKLYGSQDNSSPRKEASGTVDSFEKKNASFFDKLKERLLSTSSSNGTTDVATSGGDLKCWCTFEAASLEELVTHKRTHNTALSVSLGTSRCPKCRRRCKSSSDLQTHMRVCQAVSESKAIEGSLDKAEHYMESRPAYRGEYRFPFQMDWEPGFLGLHSSGSSVESGSTRHSRRKVFKCPHCPFWASTASRFHVHIVGHLNRKPFECSLCSYRSNWRWDITKHIKLKAARDVAHMSARVLMTDETGRRNYSKYNKYLAQVEQQALNERSMEEHSIEDPELEEPPDKVMMMEENKDFPQPPELTPAPASVFSTDQPEALEDSSPILPRPPPPLKAATRSQGQSLLKNNPSQAPASSTPKRAPSSVSTPIPNTASAVSMEETRRTLWKCKRCNYRDSSKEIVLAHVKSHYEATEQASDNEKNAFGCGDCPFAAPDATSLAMHRIHHRPNLEAIFKCYRCPYYVSTKSELLEHARLHGEELAVVHQQTSDSDVPTSKRKHHHTQRQIQGNHSKGDDAALEQILVVSLPSTSDTAKTKEGTPPPLLLDTRALPDAPLVWVSRPDGTLAKMLKCRHCPHVFSRRAEVRDHESMHINGPIQGPVIACPDCSYTCARRDIMDSHSAMHTGVLGTVHCLVDDGRPDAQQLSDLATLLGLPRPPTLGPEPDLRDSRLVHCCSKCPARFLCEKELRIHLRYHSTELAYSCQWCSYAARQPAHLLAHQKAHSPEYQERTRYLLSLYGHSQRYPPPTTACVEAHNQVPPESSGSSGVAWIVVEVTAGPGHTLANSLGQVNGSQVFTCAKCPARYFKLDALEYHMTLHGTNNRFKCTDCDYSSKTAQNLAKHQVVHRRHTEVATSLPPPRLPQPPDPQFGILMRGNPNYVYSGCLRNGRIKEKRYKCHKCPSAFEKREQYRVHLTLHGAKQRYRCDTCDYSVKYYANYVQHLKKHSINAQAQASKRQYEDESIIVESEAICETTASVARAGKSVTKSSISSAPATVAASSSTLLSGMVVSNQDKQSLMLMQRKGILSAINEPEADTIRCQDCPFGTPDKDAMDAHKRRHGIERMTPPCPHCDYVPRKDENVGEHIRLHFTRMYKPDSYLIAEMLSLSMRRIVGKDGRLKEPDLLFRECTDGRFLPALDAPPLSLALPSNTNGIHEKVIVDPNTGEARHPLLV